MGWIPSLLVLCATFPPQQAREEDLRTRMVAAYTRAGDWLVSGQSGNGAWLAGPPGRQGRSVAYTALAVDALSRAPEELRERYRKAVVKGADWIVSRRNEDGSFGEGPTGAFLKTYVTAVALMALHSVDREKHGDAIRGAVSRARAYWVRRDAGGGCGVRPSRDRPLPRSQLLRRHAGEPVL